MSIKIKPKPKTKIKETPTENRIKTLGSTLKLLKETLSDLDTILMKMESYDENQKDIPKNAELFDYLEKQIEDPLNAYYKEVEERLRVAKIEDEIEKKGSVFTPEVIDIGEELKDYVEMRKPDGVFVLVLKDDAPEKIKKGWEFRDSEIQKQLIKK